MKKGRGILYILIQIVAIAALVALCFFLPFWAAMLILAALLVRVLFFVLPTSAKEGSNGPHHALLVMDMQEALCGAEGQYKDGHKLIEAVNSQIEKAKQLGDEIVYLRQEFKPWDPLCYLSFGGRLLRGVNDTALVVGLDTSGGPQFVKTRQDAFSSPYFSNYLESKKIGSVTIVGLDAAACVLRTAQGAFRRGLSVTIVEDAVLSRSKKLKQRALSTARHEGAVIE